MIKENHTLKYLNRDLARFCAPWLQLLKEKHDLDLLAGVASLATWIVYADCPANEMEMIT